MMEVVPAPAAPANVDLNLLRYQRENNEYSSLQKAIESSPSTSSVKYPGLQNETHQAASAIPIAPAPPVVFVMSPAPPPPPVAEPKAATGIGRLMDRVIAVLTSPGHSPDPVEAEAPAPKYTARPVQSQIPAAQPMTPLSQHQHNAPNFIPASFNFVQPPHTSTYAQRQTSSVYPPTYGHSPAAPSAPPVDNTPVRTSQPSSFFSLLQEVSNHAPLERLQRGNCNAGSVQQAGLTLNNFYESGYTLRDVATLFPTFNELLSIGVNKHFFMGKKWDLKELSVVYQIPMRNLIAANCLGLTPSDMVSCGFSADNFSELGIDIRALQNAGADFLFWQQMKCTPDQFAKLGGTIEHVQGMHLNEDQRKTMASNGWNYLGIQRIPGIDAAAAVRLWPQGFSFK